MRLIGEMPLDRLLPRPMYPLLRVTAEERPLGVDLELVLRIPDGEYPLERIYFAHDRLYRDLAIADRVFAQTFGYRPRVPWRP